MTAYFLVFEFKNDSFDILEHLVEIQGKNFKSFDKEILLFFYNQLKEECILEQNDSIKEINEVFR